jgi:hypothetical protein
MLLEKCGLQFSMYRAAVFKTASVDNKKPLRNYPERNGVVAGGTGIEPATCGFGDRCSA